MKLKKNAKRVTSLFLALVMVISLFAGFEFKSDAAEAVIPAYTQASEVFADANGDGIINRLDPIRTRRNATDEVTKNNKSDIDGDGAVGALDVVLSKKVAAGLLTEESFYTRTISGDTYKSIFKHIANAGDGNVNELTWDAEENAYHYHINGDAANGYSDRNLWFDANFINKVIEYTGATAMSFRMKTGVDATSADIIYSNCDSTGANWFGGANQTTIIPSTTYQTIDVVFSELVTSDSGEMYMPLFCYQHGNGISVDLYIADITFTIPEPEDNREYVYEQFTDKVYFNAASVTYAGNVVGGGTALHNSVTTQYTTDNKIYCKTAIAGAGFYGRKFTLTTPIQNVTSDMKIKMHVYVRANSSTNATTNFRLYHIDYTDNANTAENYWTVAIAHGAWTEIEVDMSLFVDSEGSFRGFQFGNFDDSTVEYYFNWIQIYAPTPIIDWEAYTDTLTFNTTNYTVADNTVSGLNQLMSVNAASTDYFYCTPSSNQYTYYGKKFTLNTPITNVTDDMMLKLTIRASYDTSKAYGTEATFRMYHVDYTGNANDSTAYVAQTVTKPATYTLEIPMELFVDSDGTFRGFQLANFGENNTIYYLYNIQIFWERPEEVWEPYGERVYFNQASVTYANNVVGGGTALHNSVTTTYTADNKIYCKTAVAGAGFYGRKFTLNTPIQNVTSNMKLRMYVYVRANSSTNATTNFRLYHIDYTDNANTAANYVTVAIAHGVWTEIEVDMAKFMDSDRSFRGFQFGNFDDATVEYYFNWLEIYQEQSEEFDPVNYCLDFTDKNVTVSNNDLYGLNSMYEGTFTTEDNNNVLSFANSTQYSFGGKKATFKQAIENCTEDMIVTIRMKVTKPANANTTTDSTSATIRLYKADAYGIHSDNAHTELVVPVGEWTTVACTLKNLLVDGKFDGFFWADFTNNYTVVFDELTVCKTDNILEYGVSSYQLLTPADSSDIIDVATSEFNTFFKEATGTELAVVTDVSVEGNQKYISIGETSLLKEAGIEYNATELGADGFKLVTKDNNIYAIGGSDYGTLYAVYELLSQLVNYEYFYKDTYNLDTDVTEIAFKELAITETPDIATRVASDGVVGGDKMSLYRMRVRPYSESLLPIDGHWFHNSFYFVNGIASEGTTNTVDENWFNDAKTQLCYTAHGDEGAYEAMLEACLNTLKGRIKKQPDKKNVVFSIEDNSDTCTCAECTSLIEQYSAASATALLFLDDLQTKLDEWFATEEGKAYAGDFNIIFNAYKGYEAAPSGLILTNDIKCLLSPIVADYYQPISSNNATNATYYNTINGWGEFLKEGSLYVWYYGNNFRHYLAPYDSISNMQTNYKLAVANNATYLFEQRQHDETGFVTGWSNLKSYLSSKLAWDATADVTTLTSNFFNAYFGETAATHMKNYYDGLVALTSSNLNANNGFGGTKSVVQQDLCSSTYWPKATLETWLGYCDTALTSIADLQTSDSELYNTYKAHIEGEKLAILYLYIETYLTYDNATAMASYISEAQTIAGNLGVTKYCEGGSISELFDKWGAVEDGAELVWTHGENTGISGVNNSGTLSYSESVYKISDCYTYSAHKLAFVEPQTYDGNETVSIKIKATPNTTGMDNLELILIPYDFTKTLSSFNIWIYGETVEVTTQGEWTTITFDIDKFLDDDGLFTGFGFVTSGYQEWNTGQMYTIEMEAPVVE